MQIYVGQFNRGLQTQVLTFVQLMLCTSLCTFELQTASLNRTNMSCTRRAGEVSLWTLEPRYRMENIFDEREVVIILSL